MKKLNQGEKTPKNLESNRTVRECSEELLKTKTGKKFLKELFAVGFAIMAFLSTFEQGYDVDQQISKKVQNQKEENFFCIPEKETAEKIEQLKVNMSLTEVKAVLLKEPYIIEKSRDWTKYGWKSDDGSHLITKFDEKNELEVFRFKCKS